MTNPNMDQSFTRSLYIGRDKTAEVLKRREAAEKELQAKREAKIREQNERMARATQQKETELRERARHRQQRELERQKAVLDRRCAQLEKLNAKKTELLQRAHQNASRIPALNQQKKPVYVFGSSTPRELTYLENIKQQQRPGTVSAPVKRGSTPPLPRALRFSPTPPRVSSRFAVPSMKGAQGSSAMTRSVHGTLNAGTSQQQIRQSKSSPQQQKQTPNAIKRQRKAAANGATLGNQAMTQSLYVQSSSRMISTPARLPNATKQEPKKQQPKLKLNTSGNKRPSTSVQQTKDVEAPKPPPVIRPGKIKREVPCESNQEILLETQNTTTEVVSTSNKQEEIAVHANELEKQNPPISLQDELKEAPFVKAEDSILVNFNNEEESDESTLIHKPTIPFDESTLVNADPENINGSNKTSEHQQLFKFDDQITGWKEFEQAENIVEEARDASPEKQIMNTTFTINDTSSIEDDNKNIKFDSLLNDVSFGFEHLQNEEARNGIEKKSSSPKADVMTPPKSATPPATIILPDQEEREARRKRLNEILQRTRQEAPVNPGLGTNSTNGTINVISSVNSQSVTIATSASNPLGPQRDASVLAQDILAKHRHKFQQQKPKQGDTNSRGNSPPQPVTQKQPTTLANELAESGFDNDDGTALSNFYSLPGQVLGAPDHRVPFPLPPSMTVISTVEEGENEYKMMKQHPTPPEDPMINGHETNGKDFHPPEPTSTDIITLDD